MKPKLIIMDRTKEGDYYKKPTQFWFVNCEPEQNVVFEPIEFVPFHTVDHAEKMDKTCGRQVKRSLIHPQFARRFIMNYVVDADVWDK